MPFYLAHAGTSLQVLRSNGTIYTTLTPPAGVTIRDDRPARFAVLNRRVIIGNAPTESLWLDPLTFTLYRLALEGGVAPPAGTASVGAGTGLTGAYRYKVSFIQKSGGEVVNETPTSDPSNAVTLANGSLAGTLPLPTDPDVTGRRVYRTTSDGAVYLFAFDVDDVVTASFDTDDPDADLGDEEPELGAPPADLTLLTEWKSRLWARPGAVGEVDHIRYCEVDRPWAWPAGNDLPASSLGEDEYGITGFIRRRDELGVGKRNRVLRVVGDTQSNFQVIIVSEETGILAPESVVVIRDEGYFRGIDGVYKFGPDGVVPLSRNQVDTWFLTSQYFNLAYSPDLLGGYNALTDTYDLHVPANGSTTFDRMVSFHVKDGRWSGPHRTAAFTPTSRALFRDANAGFLPVIGASDGYIYLMNRDRRSDFAGDAPSTPIAIAIDWISSWLRAGDPRMTCFFGQPTTFQRAQPTATVPVVLAAQVGNADKESFTATLSQNLDQTAAYRRLNSLSGNPSGGAIVGRAVRLRFTHSTVDEDVLLYAIDVPIHPAGWRQ